MGLMCDDVVLHLSSFPGDGVPGGVANFIVDDVDALHAEFVRNGVPIQLEPTDQTWGIARCTSRMPMATAFDL
jgi:hypothetical protein